MNISPDPEGEFYKDFISEIFSYPTTYIVDALRNIYLKGSGFLDLLPDFIALATMLVVFNVWAVLSYKKSE